MNSNNCNNCVYLVVGQAGDYDYSYEWVVAFSLDHDKADELRQKLTIQVQEYKAALEAWEDSRPLFRGTYDHSHNYAKEYQWWIKELCEPWHSANPRPQAPKDLDERLFEEAEYAVIEIPEIE